MAESPPTPVPGERTCHVCERYKGGGRNFLRHLNRCFIRSLRAEAQAEGDDFLIYPKHMALTLQHLVEEGALEVDRG